MRFYRSLIHLTHALSYVQVLPVLYNFGGRAADGSVSLFRRTFSNLFETVISHIEALPQPWRRKHQVALSP